MRLLRCGQCKSIEELPDAPAGVDPHHIEPGQDPYLDNLVSRHEGHAPANLFHIEDADWADLDKRKGILEQMAAKTTGFEGDFYDVRNTFQEDAMTCFKRHNRPAEGCPDYHHDSKKLDRPTPEGRALAREYSKAPAVYVCSFCPVQSWVESQVNLANPAYK